MDFHANHALGLHEPGVYGEFVRKTGLSREDDAPCCVQGPVGAAVAEGFGQGDAVAAGEGDVVAAQRAEALDAGVVEHVAGGGEVVEGALGVDGVVEDDRVDDQAERAELFFLALALAQLAAVVRAAAPTIARARRRRALRVASG